MFRLKKLSDKVSTIGFAYSENIGYISFNGNDYGVSINESNMLTGYAYGENIGYISFDGDLYQSIIE